MATESAEIFYGRQEVHKYFCTSVHVIHISLFASHEKMYGPTDSGCSQMSTLRR